MSNQTKKFSRWTNKELSILKKLVKAGANNSEIASELGRSYATVSWKKNELGISRDKRGRSNNSSPKPKVGSRSSIKPKAIDLDNVEAFEIETKFDMGSIRATEQEKAQLRKTLSILGPKSAFVVPKHLYHQAKNIWDTEFPEYNLRFSLIAPAKTHYRIIRMA